MTIQLRSFLIDLENTAQLFPDKVALLDRHEQIITYRYLIQLIENKHAELYAMGLRNGDALLALMPNSIETAILFLACLRGGYTYAPLPCTSTFSEISQLKKLLSVRFCFLADPVSATVQAQINTMDWQVTLIKIDNKINLLENKTVAAETTTGRIAILTSGSTGTPKVMILDANRIWSSGHAFLRFHNIDDSEIRFWNYLPMHYLGGLFNLLLIPLAAGASVFIDDSFNGKTFLTFWATVERFNINSLWLVPSILRGLLTLAERTGQKKITSQIKHCYLGTAPISLEEKEKFYTFFGIQPLENYGLSETTFISSEKINEMHSRQQNCTGSVMPNISLKFIPTLTDDNITATEILVKTPYQMLGYLDENGLINSATDADGFFSTGDFGQIIDGQLQLVGRQRDIIKKGGMLIMLREIEFIAKSYIDVAEAVAVKINHSFYGESCILYVSSTIPLTDSNLFISELTRWLHKQISQHKWPEHIVYCHEFPRTSSGKIQKHLLDPGKMIYV